MLDEVGVEHEGSFEDADDDQFEGRLGGTEVGVVLVDLLGHGAHYFLDGLVAVKQSKIKTFMAYRLH